MIKQGLCTLAPNYLTKLYAQPNEQNGAVFKVAHRQTLERGGT